MPSANSFYLIINIKQETQTYTQKTEREPATQEHNTSRLWERFTVQ